MTKEQILAALIKIVYSNLNASQKVARIKKLIDEA